MNRGDRSGVAAAARRERDRLWRERWVEHRTRADLVPVVILGVNPENGHGGYTVVARDLVGKLQCRQRLEQREHRAAEQTRLLPGDDRDGALVGELSRGVLGPGRGAAALLLGSDHAGNVRAAPIVRLR